MAHEVFISYSKTDRLAAEAVCTRLEQANIHCWIAPRDVLPGLGWGAAIIEAIQASRIMVLVFSSEANKSPQIVREVERAVNHNVTIVPLRIEDTQPSADLEYFISAHHWFDALTPPLDAHLDRLTANIQRLLARPPRPTPGGDTVPPPPRRETAQEVSKRSLIDDLRARWGRLPWGVKILAALAIVGSLLVASPAIRELRRVTGGSPRAPQSIEGPSAAELFDSAMTQMRRGDSGAGLKTLETILLNHPGSPNELEVLYSLGQGYAHMPLASEHYFNLVVKNYSTSQYAAPALYRLGRIAEQQGDSLEALNLYQRVIREYPTSVVAESAAVRRTSLSTPRRPPRTASGERATVTKPNPPAPAAAPSETEDLLRIFSEAEVTEAARPTSIPTPRYPPVLQSAGIPGSVDLQFVVDTAGHAEPGSFKVMKTTHPAFAEPAKKAIAEAVFIPATYNGRKVRQQVTQRVSFGGTYGQ